MSGLDQPLLIATTGYHVRHQRSIRAAEDQGYFEEEGLHDYVYDYRGLIPGPLEREGLALAMKEHGVDIACGANVDSVILQRARGAEIFVVGGWRYITRPEVVSARHITRVADLRGKRIGLRELGGLSDRLIVVSLLSLGIDPRREVEWVMDPSFAYSNTPEHVEMLRSGKVDAITTGGGYTQQLLQEGYHLLIDGGAPERRKRPGRVIVATRQTIERRAEELAAFLRANLRAFWFCSDPASFDYLYALETRLRRDFTHNEDEHTMSIYGRPPNLEDTLMPLDGRVDPNELRSVIEEMRLLGELTQTVEPEEVLRGELVERAFTELCQRPSLQPTVVRVQEVVNKL